MCTKSCCAVNLNHFIKKASSVLTQNYHFIFFKLDLLLSLFRLRKELDGYSEEEVDGVIQTYHNRETSNNGRFQGATSYY